MQIWVNTLVKNEEKYIWYAVMSVINNVDKILIWDTGSTDKTVQIIKEIKRIYPEKLVFKEFGEVDVKKFPIAREKMLKETKSDWVLIVDGDEVWWEDSIKELVSNLVKYGKNLETVVSKYYTVVGDIYHYQGDSAGMYDFDGSKGHLNIRAMSRTIPGLHAAKPHGQQGYFDKEEKLVQERIKSKRLHIESPAYFHFTHVTRSSIDAKVPKREMKLKYEIGNNFPLDFYYPEVFFRPKPDIVPFVWENMSPSFFVKSLLTTPMRRFKRKYIKSRKTGY